MKRADRQKVSCRPGVAFRQRQLAPCGGDYFFGSHADQIIRAGLKRLKVVQAAGADRHVMRMTARPGKNIAEDEDPLPVPQNEGRTADGVPPMPRCIPVTDGSIAGGGRICCDAQRSSDRYDVL